jgi:hypothetical protein
MRHQKFDQRPYPDVPVIPHILKTNPDGSLDIVTDGPVLNGDTYEVIPGSGNRTIIAVSESRPARGDWRGEQFKGMIPTYSRIRSK